MTKAAPITSKFKGTRSRAEILARIEEITRLRAAHPHRLGDRVDDRLLAVVEALNWVLLQKNYVDAWMEQLRRIAGEPEP